MRSLICKSCGSDAPLLRSYREQGIAFVVGEWSLGSCGMWGRHPATIGDADFLYAWYASAKSAMAAGGASGDYFWSGVVRTGGYDPTVYNLRGVGSRPEVLAELRHVAGTAEWIAQNTYVADVSKPTESAYLLGWHLGELGRTMTSTGHPVAMRALSANASEDEWEALHPQRAMLMQGSCRFEPKVPERMQASLSHKPTFPIRHTPFPLDISPADCFWISQAGGYARTLRPLQGELLLPDHERARGARTRSAPRPRHRHPRRREAARSRRRSCRHQGDCGGGRLWMRGRCADRRADRRRECQWELTRVAHSHGAIARSGHRGGERCGR